MIKAIETVYNNFRFRSRLEARWAVFFDLMGIRYEYEKEGFDLGDDVLYLPDFWLPELDCWFEVKGTECNGNDQAKVDLLREQSGKPVIVAIGQIGDHVFEVGDWLYAESGVKIEASATLNDIFRLQQAYIGYGAQVMCPICHSEYAHIGEITQQDSDNYTAWEGRGFAVRLRMYCQGGHEWDMRFGYHKGLTFFNIENTTATLAGTHDFLSRGNAELYEECIAMARQSRFEHGQNGAHR